MTQPLKTVEEMISLINSIVKELQIGKGLDNIDVLSIFDQISQTLAQENKTLPEVQNLKYALDSFFIELEKYETDIIKDLGQHRSRATAHTAYISSTKRY